MQDATVLIFDVGKNSIDTELDDDSPTFYDRAKKCIETVLLRKVFFNVIVHYCSSYSF